jgi:hypothetical protein
MPCVFESVFTQLWTEFFIFRSGLARSYCTLCSGGLASGLTSAVAADSLQHLDADACDVDLSGRDAEVEALGEVGWVCALDCGCPLHFNRAVVLTEGHAHIRVTPLLAELEHTNAALHILTRSLFTITVTVDAAIIIFIIYCNWVWTR